MINIPLHSVLVGKSEKKYLGYRIRCRPLYRRYFYPAGAATRSYNFICVSSFIRQHVNISDMLHTILTKLCQTDQYFNHICTRAMVESKAIMGSLVCNRKNVIHMKNMKQRQNKTNYCHLVNNRQSLKKSTVTFPYDPTYRS